jgi:two-component system sensor kinase FixL
VDPAPTGIAPWRSPYVIGLAAFAAMVLFRYAVRDALGVHAPFLHYYPAVLVAALCGGLGPGLLITALSAASAMYFLLPPSGLAVGDSADRLSLTVFVATGGVVSWLSHRLLAIQQAHAADAQASKARAERLDAVLNLTVDGIIVIGAEGRIEAFNRGAQALFGYTEEEVLGQSVRLLMPSPDREQHDTYITRYLATGEARIIGIGREVSGRRRDGTVFPVHLSVREMRIGGERKFTGVLRDLTGHAHLQDALGASEARWRAIVDSAVDGIIVIDAHGRIEAFNHAAVRLFGYTAEEVMGRNVSMLMPSPYHEEHDGYLARYLATGQPTVIGKGREVRGRRKNGETFPVHLAVGEITINGDRKFTGILHDLSARVRMEAQLREQEALARIGEMAAVVAHEVKNPLAGIRGAMQVLRPRLRDGDSPVIDEIVARIDALDQMMKELLLFGRPPTLRRRPVDLVQLVRSTASLLTADPALRDLDIEIAGHAPPIEADPDLLRVVFQNVLLNGAHAMHGKGRIAVVVEPNGTVCQVAIADAGPGIPADIREKIFTPFFTTKSRGSGLGLPTVKRIIEAHDGQVAIDCPPSGGTTVTIQLPLSDGSAATE